MKQSLDRVAFSPGEFATLFGKSQTWGYRQIYAGKVKAITEYGRTLIPATEVDAILKKAGIYDGLKAKLPPTKEDLQALTPRLQNTWQIFLAARRKKGLEANPKIGAPDKRKPASALSGRQAALARLTGKSKGV